MRYIICKNIECHHPILTEEFFGERTLEELIADITETNGYNCTECGELLVDTKLDGLYAMYTMHYPTKAQAEFNKQCGRDLEAAYRKLYHLDDITEEGTYSADKG